MRVAMLTYVLTSLVLELSASQLELYPLKVVRHLNTTNYNFYYICSTCSYSIQWRLDNQSAGTHDVGSPVGELVSSPHSSGTHLHHYSVLVSSRMVNHQNSCFEAVLVVTGPLLEQKQISCRGDRVQKSLTSVGDVQPVETSSVRGEVKLEYVLSWTNTIQMSTIVFRTHVFVCSSALSQTWRINDISAGGFNGPNQIGDRVYQLFSDYPQVLHREAVLSTRSTSSDLTSLLLLSTTNTTSNLTVTCRGLQHSVDLQLTFNDEFEKNTTGLDYTTNPLITGYETSSSVGAASCINFIISIVVMTVIWIN